jgi:hypothetical protein
VDTQNYTTEPADASGAERHWLPDRGCRGANFDFRHQKGFLSNDNGDRTPSKKAPRGLNYTLLSLLSLLSLLRYIFFFSLSFFLSFSLFIYPTP